ncbi:LAMI_0D03576g1_1 [Lachancea mirantina]|uniref:LAMI_0D03576g1_1 n=1 Tax=Lachancea mirantina TaxID=1230905 RepID=A0A1G4J9T8_9SACH|nr:LAMI_0D03576g1_1 [Lachancea mirantina]
MASYLSNSEMANSYCSTNTGIDEERLQENLKVEDGNASEHLSIERSASTPSDEAQNSRENDEKRRFEVTLEPDDPENVMERFSLVYKAYVTVVVTLTTIIITITSSCWTLASPHIIDHFHISREVSILGISLYIFGMAVGPLLFSPLSELYGRKITFICSLMLSVCFQILTIFSPNIGGMLVGRCLSGFFGSPFLSVAGGVVSDLYNKAQIGIPMALYTTAPFVGPAIGPLISGALYGHSYRWTFGVMCLATGAALLAITVSVKETYKPILLIEKARRLRSETGDDRYYAPLERLRQETSIPRAIAISTSRPFGLLTKDPMILVLCFYTGLVLAIVYMFFVAYPLVFTKLWHFGTMEVGLSYCGQLAGQILAAPTVYVFQQRYAERVKQNNGVRVAEFRFEPLFYGAFITPIGLMIFAWTSYSHVHWIGALIGTGIFGAGVMYVFIGVLGYIVDAYRLYAASAVGCNTFVRCIMSGVFPLFTEQMYEGMGINWAIFLLAMVSVAMIPIPFLFTKYGHALREKSPYAWDGED